MFMGIYMYIIRYHKRVYFVYMYISHHTYACIMIYISHHTYACIMIYYTHESIKNIPYECIYIYIYTSV